MVIVRRRVAGGFVVRVAQLAVLGGRQRCFGRGTRLDVGSMRRVRDVRSVGRVRVVRLEALSAEVGGAGAVGDELDWGVRVSVLRALRGVGNSPIKMVNTENIAIAGVQLYSVHLGK